MKRTLFLLTAAAACWGAATVTAGGWAVTTIERLPDYAIAGQPVHIEFTIRQHGQSLASGLSGTVDAKTIGATAKADARSLGQPGRYFVDITFPTPGMWAVNFGLWGTTKVSLPVVASAADAPKQVAADQGRRLFAAKGCVTCHVHRGAEPADSMGYGPELTERRYPREVLAAKLAHPVPCESGKICMPVLGIRDEEVGPLAAFLNAPAAKSAAPRSTASVR